MAFHILWGRVLSSKFTPTGVTLGLVAPTFYPVVLWEHRVLGVVAACFGGAWHGLHGRSCTVLCAWFQPLVMAGHVAWYLFDAQGTWESRISFTASLAVPASWIFGTERCRFTSTVSSHQPYVGSTSCSRTPGSVLQLPGIPPCGGTFPCSLLKRWPRVRRGVALADCLREVWALGVDWFGVGGLCGCGNRCALSGLGDCVVDGPHWRFTVADGFRELR